ncbi:MAG: tRNA (guanosine(46)-N7)-methyltransferase TrmB [Lachnospiraceae bacterium]|nr:tRNA (guanosine(46)-N7)-methyltransferase TrmB [Lachnospiraceae bacterium]MDD7078805.1 tRNA (guanosine(46)-N7)-methyltransferase TrmB [Lachnospiraceae bacterium]MDY3730860.1 tRNA (guanosine(46)-N7)-methyltransferase TrmB [Candidatus Choladocola sp.]
MRLRNIPGSREAIAASGFVVHEDVMKEKKGCWNTVFGNEKPIFIEVGMGKGRFITELAIRCPQNNYVGIEKYSSVLLRALEKREQMEEVDNLYFLRMDAEELPEVFGENEVSGIYLNFSDPWPKDRHAKRRLPSKEFLARYDKILKPEGKVEFKTDNRGLFDFALEQVKEAGWDLEACTFDLHHDETMMEGNIMTEYEERFSAQGNPICKMIISRKK